MRCLVGIVCLNNSCLPVLVVVLSSVVSLGGGEMFSVACVRCRCVRRLGSCWLCYLSMCSVSLRLLVFVSLCTNVDSTFVCFVVLCVGSEVTVRVMMSVS